MCSEKKANVFEIGIYWDILGYIGIYVNDVDGKLMLLHCPGTSSHCQKWLYQSVGLL